MEVILEIIKITVPALIVFATVYFLMKNHTEQQIELKQYELGSQNRSTTMPLRLGAYERLSLFLERIAVPNLLFRLKSTESTNASLQFALLMAIQQEYEHNISQQVYVSDNLWQIIKTAKDMNVDMINNIAKDLDGKGDAKELAGTLMQYLELQEGSPILTAQVAVKKEAALLF